MVIGTVIIIISAKKLPILANIGIKAAGGDIVMVEDGFIQCIWLARQEEMEELAPKILNAALYIQKKYGSTETKFGRNLKNRLGKFLDYLFHLLREFDCFFVGQKMIFYVLVGKTVRESFHASSLCGSREVIVSREIWKAIGEKEAYKYQTLPDEFVTVYLRLLSTFVQKKLSSDPNKQCQGEIPMTPLTSPSIEGKRGMTDLFSGLRT
ncbi:hypothetical protein CEXT_716431 [Caerostris extrusa]|uniref:Uncharacterized protein n=1 Tax=Caerostris extrusa TaxID=172846 RepID=A0AAV4SY79_CAEEX|nr:hypothetical protein CEXT_716431 [Caerostris extrusa]